MMPSVHVTNALSAYLDGALRNAERAQVERHLETCAECRMHLESLREVVTLVRSAEPVSAPEGFRAQVRARIGELAAQPRARSRFLALPLSWRVISAAAAVFVIGVFAVNLLRSGPRSITQEFSRERSMEGLETRENRMRSAAPPSSDTAQRPAPADPMTLRRVIRSAQFEVEVDKVEDAAERLLRIAEEAGGFIAGSSSGESGGVPQASFVLRVPADRFASVVAALDDVGRVVRRSIHGQDVTEQFVDLEARVRNLERHEQRLLTFMDRATKVSELLAIEQELARVRGEIESLSGRIRHLSNQSDLATLEVLLRQKAKKTSGALWDFGGTLQRMQAAFVMTVRQILKAVENIGIVISALLPVLALGALAWLAVRRWRVRRAW